MALRTSRRLRRIGFAVIGIAAVAAFVGRKVDIKDWVLKQLAVPHGVSGWLAALMMPMAHKAFYGPAADLLDLKPEDALVEVACGSGVFLEEPLRPVILQVGPLQVGLGLGQLGSGRGELGLPPEALHEGRIGRELRHQLLAVRMDGKRTQVRPHAGLEATFDELQRDS